jgi:O-antigen/teichoic acid export membrane protein
MKFLARLRSSRALKNAAASYFAFVSMALSGFVSIPVAVNFLDKDEIGLWVIVSAVLNYLIWMDLGVGEGIGRKIAAPVAARDQSEIDRWWTACLATLMIQGAAVILIGILVTPWLVEFFEVPPGIEQDGYKLFMGSIILAGISLPVRGIPGLFTAQQRFHWSPLAQGFTPWINLAAFYLLLKAGWGLLAYLGGMAVTQLAVALFYAALVRGGPQPPHWDKSGITKTRIRELLGFSANIGVLGIVEAVFSTMPAMILARFGGLAAVPIFSITSRGPMLLASLVRRTLWSFYPQLLRLHVESSKEKLLATHGKVGTLTFAIALFAAGGVVGFNRLIVEFLAGPDFYAGDLTNTVFACVLLLEPISRVFMCLMYLAGSMGRAAFVAGLALLAGLVLSLIGFRIFGLAGLAATTAVLPLALGIYGYLRGSVGCGFELREISISAAIHTLVACGVLVVSYSLLSYFPPSSTEVVVAGKTLSMPAAAPLLVSFFLMASGVILAWRSVTALRTS